MNTITGAGELRPAPIPPAIHDEKYNVDVYPASINNAVLDILVPCYGKLNLTIECLKSLYSYTQAPFHLIILHAENPDDFGCTHRWMLGQLGLKNNITYCHRPYNWHTGNQFFNCGLKYCKTEYVATVMNSMEVEPQWEVTALELMKHDKQIGTIGFKCLFPNGYIESAGIAFNGHIPTDMFRDEPGYRCNEVRDAEAVQWAFALHRKAALDGNLEEDTFNGHVGWDDIDNCLCVRSKGWKIVYCGQGVGIHHPRSSRGSNSLDAFARNQENAHTFFKRWGLWDKYLEGNKMNVADILKPETKDLLTQAVTKIQVLQELLRKEEAAVQPLVNRAIKEIGVDPGQYLLEMNPPQNIWVLKPNVKAMPADVATAKPASDTEPGKIEKTVEEVKA